jgi:hypothetical protein
MSRTRKVSVLLQDDAAVSFDVLQSVLGLPSIFRKSGDADAAMLESMITTYKALIDAQLAKSGKSWCEPGDVEKLLKELLGGGGAQAAGAAVGAGGSHGAVAAVLGALPGTGAGPAFPAPAEEVVHRSAKVVIEDRTSADIAASIALKPRQ